MIVTPSGAVTTTVRVLVPGLSGIDGEPLPEATVVPFTLIVAPALVTVGVMMMLVTVIASVAVYDVVADANPGVSVPLLKIRLLKSALPLSAERVTVTV